MWCWCTFRGPLVRIKKLKRPWLSGGRPSLSEHGNHSVLNFSTGFQFFFMSQIFSSCSHLIPTGPTGLYLSKMDSASFHHEDPTLKKIPLGGQVALFVHAPGLHVLANLLNLEPTSTSPTGQKFCPSDLCQGPKWPSICLTSATWHRTFMGIIQGLYMRHLRHVGVPSPHWPQSTLQSKDSPLIFAWNARWIWWFIAYYLIWLKLNKHCQEYLCPWLPKQQRLYQLLLKLLELEFSTDTTGKTHSQTQT